ncbi:MULTISPECIES: amino acid ABC transporter substrate-binding protein [unclassified Variovorax]|uniref:amino acid ABC transporter substrate-binding protein n=1 Tax=unclassified Variovorax TaxID=663243 RepID=UPI001BD37215|nr:MULTISPECIES: amino acid ABC transporter substrate-binding protein [unclassified Variovorax]
MHAISCSTGHRNLSRSRGSLLLPIATALLPVLALFSPSTAAAGATLDRIKQAGVLKLGYGPDGPYTSKEGSGNPGGFALDLCRTVADGVKADLGLPALKVEYVPLPRDASLRAVVEGKVDVLCDVTVPTTATRKLVSYSIPVFASGVGAVVRRSASDRLKDILLGRTPPTAPSWRGNADRLLRDSTISVVAGTRAETVVADRLGDLQLIPRIVPVSDYAAGLARVVDGRSNIFFGDRAILLDAIRRGNFPGELQLLDRYFTLEMVAFALPRGDEDLRLSVDTALSKLFRSDEFPAVFVKWFGPLGPNTLNYFRVSTLTE